MKISYCKECHNVLLVFQSPARIVFSCIAGAIVMSGFLFGLGYILGPKEGVDESTAQTAIPVISLGFGIVVYYIINHQNTCSKEIIQKIESRY